MSKTFNVKIRDILHYLKDNKRYDVMTPSCFKVSLADWDVENDVILMYKATSQAYELREKDLTGDWVITDLQYKEREKQTLGYFVDNPDKCFLNPKTGMFTKFDGCWEQYYGGTYWERNSENTEMFPSPGSYEVFTVAEIEPTPDSKATPQELNWFKKNTSYAFKYDGNYYRYSSKGTTMLMKYDPYFCNWDHLLPSEQKKTEEHIGTDEFIPVSSDTVYSR